MERNTNEQMDDMLSPDDMMMPEEPVTEDKLKDAAMFGAEFIPGVGEAMAIKRTSDALDEGDYVGAGIEATAGLLGIVPGVGDAASKALRVSANALRTPKWFKE